MNKKVLNILLVLSLLLILFSSRGLTAETTDKPPVTNDNCPTTEHTKKTPVAAKIFDVLIVRPISIVMASASTGICIVTLPFTFITGVSEESASVLIEAPWRYTTARFLGEWDHYKDEKPITILDDYCHDDYFHTGKSSKPKNIDCTKKEVSFDENTGVVTLDGHDTKNNTITSEIFLWRELNNPLAGVNAVARHGEQAKLVKQDGELILVETSIGIKGWTKKGFIRELK